MLRAHRNLPAAREAQCVEGDDVPQRETQLGRNDCLVAADGCDGIVVRASREGPLDPGLNSLFAGDGMGGKGPVRILDDAKGLASGIEGQSGIRDQDQDKKEERDPEHRLNRDGTALVLGEAPGETGQANKRHSQRKPPLGKCCPKHWVGTSLNGLRICDGKMMVYLRRECELFLWILQSHEVVAEPAAYLNLKVSKYVTMQLRRETQCQPVMGSLEDRSLASTMRRTDAP